MSSSSVKRRSAVAAGLMLLCSKASAESAQSETEPVTTTYEAPKGCPDANEFFREVASRTRRVRAARPEEKARRLDVVIVAQSTGFNGRLRVEDGDSRSNAREVEGATCAEVVTALALVAALSVDPRASVNPHAEAQSKPAEPPAAAPHEGSPPTVKPSAPTPGLAPSPVEPPTSDRTTPTSSRSDMHGAVGLSVEGAALADLVLSGAVFGEIAFGERGVVAPSFRLGVSRSLDNDRAPSIGTAKLHWTQASLEGCPLRFAIGSVLAARPCVGLSGGVLDAEGTIADVTQRRSRPWSTVFAHGRLAWEPSDAFSIEAEAGATMPLFRETFFFEPSVPIYEAPLVAFVGRAGVAVRFP